MVLFPKVFSSVGCQIEDGRSRFLKAYLLRNEICSNHLYLRTFISSKIDNIAQHTQFTLDEIPISGTVFDVGIHNNVPLKKGISLRTCSSKSIFWSLKLEACLSAYLLPYLLQYCIILHRMTSIMEFRSRMFPSSETSMIEIL